MKTYNNTGFSLIELIVVITIMAVLVGIITPSYTQYIEKSRESADLASVHYAAEEVMAAAATGDTHSSLYDPATGTYTKTVSLKQSVRGWQSSYPISVDGLEYTGIDTEQWNGVPCSDGTCAVTYDPTQGLRLRWSGLSCNIGSCWNRTGGSGQKAGGYISYVTTGYTNGYKSNAVTQQLSAVGGQKVTVSDLTRNSTLKKQLDQGYTYKIGLFYTDPSKTDASGGSYVLYDTGETLLPSKGGTYTISRGEVKNGQSVKVAVQVFKYKTDANGKATGKPIAMSDSAEANALVSLISVS